MDKETYLKIDPAWKDTWGFAQQKYWWSFEPSTSTRFMTLTRPNFLHRFLQRWLLGIRWGEA